MGLTIKSKINEEIAIGSDIIIRVSEAGKGYALINIEAPEDIGILRDDLIKIIFNREGYTYCGLSGGKKMWINAFEEISMTTREVMQNVRKNLAG